MKSETIQSAETCAAKATVENINPVSPLATAQRGFRKFSEACLNRFQALKQSITDDLTSRFAGRLSPDLIGQVVNEADALAHETGFRVLFLPVLAEERAAVASRWQANQPDQHRQASFPACIS